MSINTSNFYVNRDDEEFRCPGDQIVSTLQQTDVLVLQRDDIQYRFKLAIGLDTIVAVDEVTTDLNYEQFAFCRRRDNGERLDETSPPFSSFNQPGTRDYTKIFDGLHNTRFLSVTTGFFHDLVVEFPKPIDVYESIGIKAGFHGGGRTGQLLINGEVVIELDAWDGDPQVFEADYHGKVSEFSIRQLRLANNECTAAINYIELDGYRLASNITSTQLTLANDANMSMYRVNMRVKQKDGSVTGVIGRVDEVNNTLTLTTTAAFNPSDEILIDQVDGDPIDFPEIRDDDTLACTDVDNITYKVTGSQFKDLLSPPPPPINHLGWIDVAFDAPPVKNPGDRYEQKSFNGNPSEVAKAGWTGIEGQIVMEGQYIMFDSDGLWKIVVEIPENYRRYTLNTTGLVQPANYKTDLTYDRFDLGIAEGPDLDGNPTVYPPNVSAGFSSSVNGTIRLVTTDINGALVQRIHYVTHYTANPSNKFRFYAVQTRPTQESVDLLQNGSSVYLDLDSLL